ncbi:TatD family hydrolase [Flavobacterium wongokense]|uniref:TatD family hydrolase n=1 Tax=Flavobacterium wongokense TaxID=2910674 RepID=UPI001F1FA7FA|nr:TatD family hydrolase [Flavobacterium sp. WG47]MCF6132230.1 TatD family hydrolase [Flavobacterium sp. WG47]
MKFYNLHTHKFTHDANVMELVNQYPWEFDAGIPLYSVGIHPWHINQERLESDLKVIEQKLSLKECLALGECGLDKRIEIPMALQTEVFEKQIALAELYRKPLVLHLVAAFDELLEIKKRLKISVPIIIHGFSKNEQVAKQLLDNGFYLSFGKYLLQNPELKKVFQMVPNNRFFLETDMIEETLEQVYALASDYKQMALDEMKLQVADNWKTVFGP